MITTWHQIEQTEKDSVLLVLVKFFNSFTHRLNEERNLSYHL